MAWLTVAVTLIGMISSAFSSRPLDGLGPIANPLGMEGFSGRLRRGSIDYVPPPVPRGGLIAVRAMHRAVGVERQQLKWLAYAAATLPVGIILTIIPGAIDTPPWFEWAGVAFFVAAGAGIPISMGIAILRYRLYDIDRRHQPYPRLRLAHGDAGSGLLCLHRGVAADLRCSHRPRATLAVVVSTLVIAALFNPLRRRIQSFIDRRFYRRKYDARKTLEAFSSTLREETDLEAMNDYLVGVVQKRCSLLTSLCGCVLRLLRRVGRRSKCCLFTEARRIRVLGSSLSPGPTPSERPWLRSAAFGYYPTSLYFIISLGSRPHTPAAALSSPRQAQDHARPSSRRRPAHRHCQPNAHYDPAELVLDAPFDVVRDNDQKYAAAGVVEQPRVPERHRHRRHEAGHEDGRLQTALLQEEE